MPVKELSDWLLVVLAKIILICCLWEAADAVVGLQQISVAVSAWIKSNY